MKYTHWVYDDSASMMWVLCQMDKQIASDIAGCNKGTQMYEGTLQYIVLYIQLVRCICKCKLSKCAYIHNVCV